MHSGCAFQQLAVIAKLAHSNRGGHTRLRSNLAHHPKPHSPTHAPRRGSSAIIYATSRCTARTASRLTGPCPLRTPPAPAKRRGRHPLPPPPPPPPPPLRHRLFSSPTWNTSAPNSTKTLAHYTTGTHGIRTRRPALYTQRVPPIQFSPCRSDKAAAEWLDLWGGSKTAVRNQGFTDCLPHPSVHARVTDN